MLGVGGKAFREPDILESEEADGVAVPLMGKFVSDHHFIGAVAGDDVVAQSSHGLMFHGAVGAHAHHGLAIFFKGIGAKDLREILDHVWQMLKIYQGVVILVLHHEVHDGQRPGGLWNFHIGPRSYADQIGGHGMLAQPVSGAAAVAVVCDAVPQTVGGHFPIGAHGDMQVNQSFVPGVIITGPPLPGSVGV